MSLWVTKSDLDKIRVVAKSKGKNVSEVVRDFIKNNISQEIVYTEMDFICKVLTKQINATIKADIERIVKLIIKGIISSEKASYFSFELLSKDTNIDKRELQEKAYNYALTYLRKSKNIESDVENE